MEYEKQIQQYLENSGGIITSAYCREYKIPTVYLSRLVKRGILTKVATGIYLSKKGNYDEFYFFQYRYKKAIFSYETALYLLGVTDKIPHVMDVTVNYSYKLNSDIKGFNIHYVKDEILNLGVLEKKTMFGNLVKIYSYERNLCDFIQHKEEMDSEVYVKLIRSYSDYEGKNIHALYEIAEKMNIVKEVRDIMEVVNE